MKRNVTLSIDEDLLNRARVMALRKKTTVNAMIREYLEATCLGQDEYERAGERLARMMRTGLFEVGEKRWSREELHDRSR